MEPRSRQPAPWFPAAMTVFAACVRGIEKSGVTLLIPEARGERQVDVVARGPVGDSGAADAYRSDRGECVGRLAREVPVVARECPVAQVDRLFRQDGRLRAVVVSAGAGWSLLSREQLQVQLTGPLGYGRSLHSRSTVTDFIASDPFVLLAELPVEEAAARILTRDPDSRYHDVLVVGATGPLVVSVAAIFERLSVMFRHAALHDPLTGLPNRSLLEQYGGELAGGVHDPARTAMLYIDLDGFKLVNDTFGHRAGDELLVTFGERVRSCVRPSDVVARLGGDEFAAMLLDVTEVQAMAVAERVVVSASAPFVHAGEPLYVSASVGVAMAEDLSPEHGFSQLDALLRLADNAMLNAKRSGKSRVERSLGERQGHTLQRRGVIRRQLRAALNRDEGLWLCYQPQLDLVTGEAIAVEALLRWTDPELGAVSPEEFIPIAEVDDQIHRVGHWVLNQACAQAGRWFRAGQPRVVSVNISTVQLRSPGLVQSIQDALTTWELPPHLLRVEITETSAVLDMHATLIHLHTLRGLGVEIELDDFGTGYSSLSMLRDLPLTAVKIDKSFIDGIDGEPSGAALVRGVIEAAHALGLSVTAEGVERPEQLAILRALGCDKAQGFLIAHPTTASSLTSASPQQT